jgi:threonylcarbamoyladenosine tRNA methylthiotransferase MtaB
MPQVDKVIGNSEKLSHVHYRFDDNKIIVSDIMQVKESAHHLVSGFEGKSRAFLEIQNGCDHRCTFCIIPLVRGNSRSTPIGVITDQIKLLVESGYKEIVFTGVDITSYGSDLPGRPGLAQLIKRVFNVVPELSRLRLSSIDVAEIDEELFDLAATNHKLMPHFHLSLQSGDDMILKRMKRRHRRDQVIDFCKRLRKARPNVAFGADIIVGFPTETDDMFQNSMHLVQEADLQYLHVFPYSPREGTPAARIPQLDRNIIKERSELLRALGEVQLQRFFIENLNKRVSILYEGDSKGRTENFIPIKFQDDSIDYISKLQNGCLIDSLTLRVEEAHVIAEPLCLKTI